MIKTSETLSGTRAPQDVKTGSMASNSVVLLEYTTSLSRCTAQSLPRWAYTGPHQRGPGTPPHPQRLSCGQRGRYLRWLPRMRPLVQGWQL
jgi:hypothetical protein